MHGGVFGCKKVTQEVVEVAISITSCVDLAKEYVNIYFICGNVGPPWHPHFPDFPLNFNLERAL